MAKKDEDHVREMARLQTQLLDVLERRPEPIAIAPLGPAHHRGNDPNVLYEPFRKRGPKEFTGTEDPRQRMIGWSIQKTSLRSLYARDWNGCN